MTFSNDKKMVLSKQDKSKKGCFDSAIIPLLDAINAHPAFYTSSSCSGRILLLTTPVSGRKDEVAWLFSTHNVVVLEQLSTALSSLKTAPVAPVWFRMEGFILHVCCKTIEDAMKLVLLARDAGIKRSGIISATGRKISVEIIDTERLDCPIADKGSLLVPEEYLHYLLECANKKLKRTQEKIKKVKEAFSASF